VHAFLTVTYNNNNDTWHPFNGPLSWTTHYTGEPLPERSNQSGFYWSKRQWVAVASAGPHASLHLAIDRYPCQHPTTWPDSYLEVRTLLTSFSVLLLPIEKHHKLCNIIANWSCKDGRPQLCCFKTPLLQWSSCHRHCCVTYFRHQKVWPHPSPSLWLSSLAASPETLSFSCVCWHSNQSLVMCYISCATLLPDLCCRVLTVDSRQRLHSTAQCDLVVNTFTWDSAQHSSVAALKAWIYSRTCCTTTKQLMCLTQRQKLFCLAYRPTDRDWHFVSMGTCTFVIALPGLWMLEIVRIIIIMATHSNGQAILFYPCGFFFLFSSPILSRRRLNVCHTFTHDVALVYI